jgi:hypothetical protein
MYEGNSKHKDSLQVGQDFEDFVVKEIEERYGYRIHVYRTKDEQFNIGESKEGFEIKYDARSTGDCTYGECSPTGYVAIEVAEKTSPSQECWVDSGIYRNDNSIWYVVGNYQRLWIFSKKKLKDMYRSGKYKTVKTKETLKTMLIPIKEADVSSEKNIVIGY